FPATGLSTSVAGLGLRNARHPLQPRQGVSAATAAASGGVLTVSARALTAAAGAASAAAAVQCTEIMFSSVTARLFSAGTFVAGEVDVLAHIRLDTITAGSDLESLACVVLHNGVVAVRAA